MEITSDNKSEGLESIESIEEVEEIQEQIKEIEKTKVMYLSEPSLNSELLLFNNNKLLVGALKKNVNPLSLNIVSGKYVNRKVKNTQSKKNKGEEYVFEIENFEKAHNKVVFLTEVPKYNDKYLDEIMELRKQYEELDVDTSQGLQKIKRDIRNRIRDLSSITYVYRDRNVFGNMIMILMNKIITRQNFSGYSYKDEMKSLATEHILKYTWRFNSYKQSKISNQYISSFTYISTIIFNAFIATINKQNDEHKKAKQDFLETQVAKYKDIHVSTYGENASSPEKEVSITVINDTLFNEIQKIKIDCKDILVKYPPEYQIDMAEYKKITDFSSSNNISLSLVRF